LPNWKGKEYHGVVRSGSSQLGQWLSEERNLQADYRRYIDDDVPGRIVAVWLISNSAFQRLPGDCVYSDIILADGQDEIQVL
jgi:hypothetical protein